MIPVSKPSMPDRKRLDRYLSTIYGSARLTNNGPLVQELTARLEDYLGVRNLLLVANGTLALQVAYRALGLGGAQGGPQPTAITTPFTFVATESSLRWEGIEPLFADIDRATLNLSPIEAGRRIRESTRSLVPVHVYGNPCDVQGFDELATRHGLRTVYDAAHAFGVGLGGRSILGWGDASTLSFHATKVFHTVEGGGIVFRDADDRERAEEIMNFGCAPGTIEVRRLGINAKLSEVHAAFGLALLEDIDRIIGRRLELCELYSERLGDCIEQPSWSADANRVGAYMPVLFATPAQRSACEMVLAASEISSRRYFSPCLAPPADPELVPIARTMAERILCLPLYPEMRDDDVSTVVQAVRRSLGA